MAAFHNIVAPGLLARSHSLQLFTRVLEMVLVEMADRLEAPGECTDKVVVEALHARLLLEEAHPGFKDLRAQFQILHNIKIDEKSNKRIFFG